MSRSHPAYHVMAARTKADVPEGEDGFEDTYVNLARLWVDTAGKAGIEATISGYTGDIFPSGEFALVRVGDQPVVLEVDDTYFKGDAQIVTAREPYGDFELEYFKVPAS